MYIIMYIADWLGCVSPRSAAESSMFWVVLLVSCWASSVACVLVVGMAWHDIRAHG
jgi:hypothetical protein